MESKIGFTKVKLPYGWLGNMSPYPIEKDGVEWKTTEALFQAMRFDDPTIKEAIRLEKSPFSAKLIAKANRKLMIVDPCSEQDVNNMKKCLLLKINAHPELALKLKETGKSIIFEDVSSRGNSGSNLFWGAILIGDSLIGKNVLGELWMEIRDTLK